MLKINFKKLPLKWYHTTHFLSFCFLISISQTLSHVSTITSTLSSLYVATDLFCTVILYLMIKMTDSPQKNFDCWYLRKDPCSLSSLSIFPHNQFSFLWDGQLYRYFIHPLWIPMINFQKSMPTYTVSHSAQTHYDHGSKHGWADEYKLHTQS